MVVEDEILEQMKKLIIAEGYCRDISCTECYYKKLKDESNNCHSTNILAFAENYKDSKTNITIDKLELYTISFKDSEYTIQLDKKDLIELSNKINMFLK